MFSWTRIPFIISREFQGFPWGFGGFSRGSQEFLDNKLNFISNVILYGEKMIMSILLKCLLKD